MSEDVGDRIVRLHGEMDNLRSEVQNITLDRDYLLEQVQALTQERDDLKEHIDKWTNVWQDRAFLAELALAKLQGKVREWAEELVKSKSPWFTWKQITDEMREAVGEEVWGSSNK